MSRTQYTPGPMPDHDSWPAFTLSWDDNSPGPTDMSFLLEAPAGATGFVRNVGGHLATGDGQRLRLWGLNLCTQLPLPPMESAPIVARRLAKYGVNCVRLHAIDHRWPMGVVMRAREPGGAGWRGSQDESTRVLDPEGLARLDYFVYCCKQRGIYLDLNLNVARTFTLADGVIQAEQVRWGKGLTYFDPQLIALQKEYARQLVSHINPFTGLRYADEPAIALIELVNENSLLEFWARGLLSGGDADAGRSHWYPVPPAYLAQLDRRWNARLAQRYPDRTALAAAWDGDLRDNEDPAHGSVSRLARAEFAQANAARFREEVQFYTDIERDFFLDMRAFLRGPLEAKQLILGTSDHNHGWSALPMLEANASLDVMDGHFYWQHPRSRRPGQQWRHDDWFIPNTPMVDDPDASLPAHCSRSIVRGLPYIVSELNEPFPNDYAAEFVPIAAAYGLLQGWDGIIFYDYDGTWATPYWQNEEWREPPRVATFEMGPNPARWSQFALGALMFLRGDVQQARQTVRRTMPHDWVLESLRAPGDAVHPYWVPHIRGRLGLVHRTEIDTFEGQQLEPGEEEVLLPQGVIASDTGELTWEEAAQDGRVLIDTPRHQCIIGRGGKRATSNLLVELTTPFAAVQLASLDGRSLACATTMLLVASARVANTGMRWLDDSRQSLGAEWGRAPVRIEPVTGTVYLRRLQDARGALLQPLDAGGQPQGSPRPFVTDDGSFVVTLDGVPPTPWYLVTVERQTAT